MYLALACSELALDVITLTLPWTVIWRLHMKTSQKLSILGIFMLGGLWVYLSSPNDFDTNRAELAFVCRVSSGFITTVPLIPSTISPVKFSLSEASQ